MPCFHCNFLSQMCQLLFFHTFAAHLREWEGMHTHTHAHTHSCSCETSLALAHTVLLSPEMYLVRTEERGGKKIERKKGWCNYVWIPKHLHQGFLIFLQTFASEIQLPQCSHKTFTFIWLWLSSPFIFSYLKQAELSCAPRAAMVGAHTCEEYPKLLHQFNII